jgi:hypothetical protein
MENMKPAPTPAAHPAAILAIILASYFMILLDNSVIFTALPSLQADLHLTTSELTWVQDAYTLVFGGLLLLGARGRPARPAPGVRVRAGGLLGRFAPDWTCSGRVVGDRRPRSPGHRSRDRGAGVVVPADSELSRRP